MNAFRMHGLSNANKYIFNIYLNCRERYEDVLITVINTALAAVKFKPEKQFRSGLDLNPCPLRYQCSTLRTELSSHLGAGHRVSL